jgi:alpha-tubulin suppressor-like RCC1 family protein
MCWGDNYALQLGRTTPTGYGDPALWSSTTPVTAGVAGRGFTCVLYASGQVACFGDDARGQTAQAPIVDAGTTPSPAVVAGLMNVVELAAESDHVCARISDGAISCWGRDVFGQLGGGPVGGSSATPVAVTLPAKAKQIAAGGEHTCALLVDDTVWCWGRNTVSSGYAGKTALTTAHFGGQIGLSPTGSVDLLAVAPRQVHGFAGTPVRLALGYGHSCALLRGGAAACWGWNVEGELGRPSSPFEAGVSSSTFERDPDPVPAPVEF